MHMVANAVPEPPRHQARTSWRCGTLVLTLLSRVRALSFHFGFISWGWSLSFLHLLLLFLSCFYFSMLLLSCFRSLVRLASLSSLFSFLGTCRRVQHGQYSALVMRLSDACSPFGLAALFCVAWVGADAIVSIMFFRDFCIRASQSPRPLPLHVRGIEERFVSQSLTLLLLGRAGW